jgi:hypothetical protein
MLLCTVARVLSDLGFDVSNMPNITNATIAALNFAEQTLASSLGTGFAQQTVTDQYFVHEPSLRRMGNVRTVFRLSQGFVNPNVALIGLLITKTGTLFDGQVGYLDYELVPTMPSPIDVSQALSMLRSSNDALGFEKGVVVDQSNGYSNQWVSITYQCGFPVSQTDATSYDLTTVPQWLQTAAHLSARIALQSNPALEDPAIKLDTDYMRKQLDVLLAPHVRYAPYALLPDA